MKRITKKAIATLLAATLTLSAAQPSQAARAGVKKQRMTAEDEGPYAYFAFPSSDMREWIYKGKSIQAKMVVPSGAKIKSVTLTSSNQKVIKIVNAKKGRLKAIKKGKAKLTLKVVWKYSGRLDNPRYKYVGQSTNYRTATKKSGHTYTTICSNLIYVYRR